MPRNISGTEIVCRSCGYRWLTQSRNLYVSCPRCLNKVRVPGVSKL